MTSRPEGPQDPAPPVLLVTGMSGAGRTTAIHALEDLGYEPLDNFPLSLLGALIEPARNADRPVAVGIETRTRGFSTRALMQTLDMLRNQLGVPALVIFLDCAEDALLSRFSETRRRHPLAPDEDPATGIARERDILAEVRARADVVIDTTDLTPHMLRAEVAHSFSPGTARGLSVTVQSFSYKRGAPHDADIVLDCRFLRNPYWQSGLRALDGRAPEIQDFVANDPLYPAFFEKLAELITMLLPAYQAEGKAYLSIALGCTGGRHRSVAVGEALAARLGDDGWVVALRHRELGEHRRPAPRDGREGNA